MCSVIKMWTIDEDKKYQNYILFRTTWKPLNNIIIQLAHSEKEYY